MDENILSPDHGVHDCQNDTRSQALVKKRSARNFKGMANVIDVASGCGAVCCVLNLRRAKHLVVLITTAPIQPFE